MICGSRLLAVLTSLGFLLGSIGTTRAEDPAPVRVTIVVILASTEKADIQEKLTALAQAIQKRDPKLIGFQINTVIQKSIPVGDAHTVTLLDDQKLTITIVKPKDKAGRVGLTIKPPGLDEITYTCACEKFFPIITPYKTKSGEQLIIAIMAKPCTGKGP